MVDRHYCKFCNAWMQGDKQAIKHHEHGKRHKEKVDEALKKSRDDKNDAAHADRDLQKQLQAIEAAALARHAEDLAPSAPAAAVPQSGQTRVPPPPPPRHSGQSLPPPPPPRQLRQAPPPPPRRTNEYVDPNRRNLSDRNNEYNDDNNNDDTSAPTIDDYGVYATDDSVFLEGKRHETKLESGSACEIWVDALDAWRPALIEHVVVHTIPNTDRSFRAYTVTYIATADDASQTQEPATQKPTTETNVYADRLRIRLPPGLTLASAQRLVQQMDTGVVVAASSIEPVVAPVVIDEATGMGEWNTVAVVEVDESAAGVAQRTADAAAAAAALDVDDDDGNDDDGDNDGDDALGAFNPWGGKYKGVDLTNSRLDAAAKRKRDDDALARRLVGASTTTTNDVAFKARKQATKHKRIRARDDE